MARFCGDHNSESILRAAAHWRDKALLAQGSVFSDRPLWQERHLASLQAHIVDKPDESEGTFTEKLRKQLSPTSAEAKQLAAEMLWVMFLCPSNQGASSKRDTVRQVWDWSGERLSRDQEWLRDEYLGGVGSAGTSFGVHRWRELAFFIRFVRDLRSLPKEEQAQLLADPWEFADWIGALPDAAVRQLRHMFLFLLFPDTFERIFGGTHRRLIVEAFTGKSPVDLEGLSPVDIDRELQKIRGAEQKKYPNENLDFYVSPLKEKWKPEAADPREAVNESPRAIRYWIEKTIVEGRPDRTEGPHALGRALWSPQTSADGRDFYAAMKDVRVGDVVLHLTDNRGITAFSVADGAVDTQFVGVAGTSWANRPAFRVPLRDYTKIDPPLLRKDFLGKSEYKEALTEIRKRYEGLFYSRTLELNQGAYLTEVPLELVELLNEAYIARTGRALPFVGTSSEAGNVWIFQANPRFYDIDAAIRELKEIQWVVRQYTGKIKRGDRVFIWRAGPDAGIVGTGIVESNPAHISASPNEAKFVKEAESFAAKEIGVRVTVDKVVEPHVDRLTIRQHPALNNLSILRFPNATNFAVTEQEANALRELIRKTRVPTTKVESPAPTILPVYSIQSFEAESGIPSAVIDRWRRRLMRKKHIVFQGPPGTGKTYVAERMAKLVVSNTPGVVEVVQFHPSYAYEDFVQGIRPDIDAGKLAFTIRPGRFLEFCKRAEGAAGAPCVLIIDELNRANLSRVFGELMYLLEYRDKSIPLAVSGESFRVPENVFVVGTMNTADRSIALVDHALRRRFSFIHIGPDYEVLKRKLDNAGIPSASLVEALRKVNDAIGDKNYEVGISFFLADIQNLRSTLQMIWEGEIEPYLEEYFFDQPDKANELRWERLSKSLMKDWLA